MYAVLEIAFFCALFSTLGVLGFGLFVYFKGGALHVRYGNAAMRWRIMLQGLTLVLFFLMLLSRSN